MKIVYLVKFITDRADKRFIWAAGLREEEPLLDALPYLAVDVG